MLGFVISLSLKSSLNLIFGIGFCGSLTTFSGWMLDSIRHIQNGNAIEGILLLIMPLTIGIFLARIGFFFGRKVNFLVPSQLLASDQRY